MKPIHAKSPCCQGRIIKFGKRRRQCIECRKTWRIRRKKRGRKSKRSDQKFVLKYLNREIAPLYTLARKQRQSERALRNRLKRSRDKLLSQTSWPRLPQGPLLAVADGMIVSLKRTQYTFYFIVLRPVNSNQALVTRPYCKLGAEVAKGWTEAFDQLPGSVKSRIKALICDGHRGLISVGQHNNWLVQRCHFHILAAIQGRRSKWIRSRHQALGQLIYRLTSNILTNTDQARVIESLIKIKEIALNTSSPQLRKILLGFVSYHEDFRTYLEHPELQLPKTTNSVESLISMVRNLCYRARGFRTLNSLTQWIEAFLKKKQRITCNGYDLPTEIMS